jgi:hypothetical protein
MVFRDRIFFLKICRKFLVYQQTEKTTDFTGYRQVNSVGFSYMQQTKPEKENPGP